MNSKGKWGIFPKDYVGGLEDTRNSSQQALSPVSVSSPTRSFTSLSTSAHTSAGSGKKFTLSGISSSSKDSNSSAPEKDPEQHSGHHLFKRKATGFASPFGRRSGTVKSHASNASSEYSQAEHVDINKL